MSITKIKLTSLATNINRHHKKAQQYAKSAIEHALGAGELLNQTKGKLSHGEWLPWLSANTNVNERTARRYMRLDKYRDQLKTDTVSDLTVTAALRCLSIWERIFGNVAERKSINDRLSDEAMKAAFEQCSTFEEVDLLQHELFGLMGREYTLIVEAKKTLQLEYKSGTTIVDLLTRDKPGADKNKVLEAIGLNTDVPLMTFLNGSTA